MARSTNSREVFSLPEAAEFLGVDDRTLRDWVKHRDVPCAKIGGLLRFRRVALLRWLREMERTSPPARARKGAGE